MSKRISCAKSILCVIVDGSLLSGKRLVNTAYLAAAAGADLIQYRDKSAAATEMTERAIKIKKVLKRLGVPLIINDRVEVALASGASGIHIGQADPDASLVRKLCPGLILGISASTLQKASLAKKSGADYIGIGPVFATPIKPKDRTVSVKMLKNLSSLGLPLILIGGITRHNVERLLEKVLIK